MLIILSFTSVGAAAPPDKLTDEAETAIRDLTMQLSDHEKIVDSGIDETGEPYIITVESIPVNEFYPNGIRPYGMRHSLLHHVKKYYVFANCSFYVLVVNNQIETASDWWIGTIGATYQNVSPTKNARRAQLSFDLVFFQGIGATRCWVRATVTGKDCAITVTNN